MNTISKTALVGLSGGIDSSVAAMLLKQQGYQVIGVTMAIWDGKYTSTGKHACYGPGEQEEIREARELAEFLGISYHVFDCSREYKAAILEYFKSEYLAGRTPNPCIQCNQQIKFGILPDLALRSGLAGDFFATGHYARVEQDEKSKRFLLKKAIDPKKDQTYFLYRLTQEQLSRTLFPLGRYRKPEVRELARNAGIPAPDKEESQDFYSGDYKDLLGVADTPGKIVDRKGNVLGMHRGFWNFTMGQRKGLGVAYSEPLYVIDVDPANNTVVVGTREETLQTTFLAGDMNWISLEKLEKPMEVKAKIRSAQQEREALIEPFGKEEVKVTFFHPNDAVTPGQSAVFYDGESVVGGGIIRHT